MTAESIGMEDFLITCPECNGTGTVIAPRQTFNAGIGRQVIGVGPQSCRRCQKHGKLLTPFGLAIMDFVDSSEFRTMTQARHRPKA